MEAKINLPNGQIRIKCIIRTFKDAPTQIFGTVVSGAEHLSMEECSTTMIVADLLIMEGIKAIDTEGFSNDGLSRDELMKRFI